MLEGKFNAKATTVELGFNRKNQPEIKIDFEIADGAAKGSRVPYSGLFTEKAVRYTRRDLKTLGWKGETISTAPDDIMKAARVVPVEVVIASWKNPDTGKTREWSTVRSIGFVAEPLRALDGSTTRDVDNWLAEAEAGAAGGGSDVPF